MTVGTSIASMVLDRAILVFVAGGICCVNAITLILRQHKINSSPGKFMLRIKDTKSYRTITQSLIHNTCPS